MNAIKDARCGHDDGQSSVNRQRIVDLGLPFPAALCTADGMAALSQALKQGSCCHLPFCSTVEGEALGADIFLGDDHAGPRARGNPGWQWQEPLVFPCVDFSSGRIGEVLAACRLLKEWGEFVALEVSGPITILNCLMELGTLFRTWRKHPEWVEDALQQLMRFQLRYMQEAVAAGVDLLCYADPLGTYSILGPKHGKRLMAEYVAPLLQRVEALGGAGIHLCPKTSLLLTEYGFAQWERVTVGPVDDYAQGCLRAAGKGRLFGEACLKNTGYRLRNGEIQTLRLQEETTI